ncbi:endonuclease/exonuclease/phosphatase family protein [Pseudoalteromonas sp. MMG024]|uniref:endonuclease/exonuclease/phosphatase family protein n=1 Tax=Pseudoalteromonas sp. MMG024 TaxID=2909980 RepID=UPI0031BB97D5|nr:endonuclease/exonuclease/phosphatase family protein [Pseudoalteromonas sp. MMG024]
MIIKLTSLTICFHVDDEIGKLKVNDLYKVFKLTILIISVWSFNVAASSYCDNTRPDSHIQKNTVTVMSANIAHGRGTNFSQLTSSIEQIKTNLNAIATKVNQINPDIVAFQEIDKASWWSGQFSHVDYLLKRTNFQNYVATSHVNAWWGNYGTALFSKLALINCDGVTFAPSWPTTNKGFSYARVTLHKQTQHIIVVSLHLDFSRSSVRNKQIKELLTKLKDLNAPIIIMGDFNTDWRWQNSIVKTLSDNYGLRIYNAHSNKLNTFGAKRLDWIMVSKHFTFKSYYNVKDALSDHVFVVAELEFSEL